jgi:NADH:ubiquinone oxidoreductase subunit E
LGQKNVSYLGEKLMNKIKDTSEVSDLVQQVITKHGTSRDALIPILAEINSALGYIPGAAIKEIRKQLSFTDAGILVSESQLFSMASFYHMLSTQPRGKHVVKFCENAPCHVIGGREVWQALRDQMELKAGETSPDGLWSLVTTSCLGLCSEGPIILVDEDVYSKVTPAQLPEILARYE